MTIQDLEKQILDLDNQYQIDILKPLKEQMGFTLAQGFTYTMDINRAYIPKKIELEVKLAILKVKK